MIYVGKDPAANILLGGQPVQAVYKGQKLVWSPDIAARALNREEVHEFSEPGDYVISAPSWARSAQIVVLGGGGSGSGGDWVGSKPCNGGEAGQWGSTAMAISPQLNILVGSGGEPGELKTRGNPGGESKVYTTGSTEIVLASGAGGAGGQGYGDPQGRSPGDYEVFGRTFIGGGVVQQLEDGKAPGGGSGAASTQLSGRIPAGRGGDGCVWVIFAAAEYTPAE